VLIEFNESNDTTSANNSAMISVSTRSGLLNQMLFSSIKAFFKENVRYLVWICTDPISLILGTRFSQILWTRCEILGTQIRSPKKP